MSLPGEQFSFSSPWAKASRWVIRSGTHLLGKSGRLNHRVEKEKRGRRWISAVVTTESDKAPAYSAPPAWRHCRVTVIVFNRHASLACRHALAPFPDSGGWACCDFASWNRIATHYCTLWHPNSILSAGQRGASERPRGNVSISLHAGENPSLKVQKSADCIAVIVILI